MNLLTFLAVLGEVRPVLIKTAKYAKKYQQLGYREAPMRLFLLSVKKCCKRLQFFECFVMILTKHWPYLNL